MSRRQLKTPDTKSSKKAVFCGAFSIMALTGKSHDEVHAGLCKANNWHPNISIRGLLNSDLLRGLRHFGLNPVKVAHYRWSKDRPTLARWIDERRGEEKHHCYLIHITGHYVVINGNEFIDTFTRVAVKLDDCPHRRARVVNVWRIKNK